MPEVNMNIVDGQAFFAHETSINFTPSQIMLDFKSVTPRTDPRNKTAATFVLVHNVVMLDPFHAKQIHKILGEALKKYEDEFGKIGKPKAMEKAEKQNKKREAQTAKAEVPVYMG
jgi:hypothetical protein